MAKFGSEVCNTWKHVKMCFIFLSFYILKWFAFSFLPGFYYFYSMNKKKSKRYNFLLSYLPYFAPEQCNVIFSLKQVKLFTCDKDFCKWYNNMWYSTGFGVHYLSSLLFLCFLSKRTVLIFCIVFVFIFKTFESLFKR